MPLIVKRVYEEATSDDGYRVLIDRLWPRGLSKEKASLDLWAKELAPGDELRRWFNHRIERWPEFEKRYQAELAQLEGERFKQVEQLARIASEGTLTLLYAAKDMEHNNAIVFQNFLRNRFSI
ncbi:MAG TPA: DUF488 family protein [Chloroflexia bacterium]|nr:DUF488 family protein [Chloroflexia bacterium]